MRIAVAPIRERYFRASVENAFDNDYLAGVASFGIAAQGAPLNGEVLHDGPLRPASP
jgi:hypothetical protein